MQLYHYNIKDTFFWQNVTSREKNILSVNDLHTRLGMQTETESITPTFTSMCSIAHAHMCSVAHDRYAHIRTRAHAQPPHNLHMEVEK